MQKATLKVLIGTLILTIVVFVGSFFYYNNINSSEDPRILQARMLLQQYEKQLEEDQAALALNILDEMAKIFQKTPGYAESYEMGVVLNNKATVYLVHIETELLEGKQIDKKEMEDNLDAALKYTLAALHIYEKWNAEMGHLSPEQIRRAIMPYFKADDLAFEDYDAEAILQNRVEAIKLAQIETPRRMSVSHSNLGMINRYKGNLEESKSNYEKAIHLWDKNYTAQNNLNVLMDLPIKKRSMIDKLFPPERKKEVTKENS